MTLDLTPYATRLSVERAALQALIDVETSGTGLEGGRPVIRLEVHLLWLYTPKTLRVQVDNLFVARGPQPWEGHHFLEGGAWRRLHRGQDLEWRALAAAKSIYPEAAIKATSWGFGQILGVHWSRLGFASASAFEAAQSTETGQLDTLTRFLSTSAPLLRALQVRDWDHVALEFNGSGQVPTYSARLAEAYARHSEA